MMHEGINRARELAGVSIPQLADYLKMSYYELGQILNGSQPCPTDIKEKIKFFLIKNYTECIDKL